MAPPSPLGRGGLGGRGKEATIELNILLGKYSLMNLTQSIINPEILGGTPVFPNTPIPIKTFLDYSISHSYEVHNVSDFREQ